ncbi:hypothetical protein N7520_004376 [Penicillium odoratum]|uniref:uncharacterized protein n=1 Tax=Penicillium odoratum TaxID=1167516 RepID=UPI0025489080|nr:uncharacterized protein N7520_004376 [Penicillium odoratum]KAJ5764817.1 hypothetical protein N7520_004376 [Penicillium odoratum]
MCDVFQSQSSLQSKQVAETTLSIQPYRRRSAQPRPHDLKFPVSTNKNESKNGNRRNGRAASNVIGRHGENWHSGTNRND